MPVAVRAVCDARPRAMGENAADHRTTNQERRNHADTYPLPCIRDCLSKSAAVLWPTGPSVVGAAIPLERLLALRPSQLRETGLDLVGLRGGAGAVEEAAFSVEMVGTDPLDLFDR